MLFGEAIQCYMYIVHLIFIGYPFLQKVFVKTSQITDQPKEVIFEFQNNLNQTNPLQ